MNTLCLIAAMFCASLEKNELPEAVVKVLQSDAKMEVFYLDGTIAKGNTPAFHNYAIVKSVEAKDKKQVVEALLKDVAAAEGGPREFKATHGIRIDKVDILLGDSWVFVYYKDEERKDLRLGNRSSVLKVLDALKK